MSKIFDIVIIGAGPGGIAAGVVAAQAGKSYIIIEKGKRVFQGIIDSYPRGKRVYPTIPKNQTEPFPIDGITPPKEKIKIEDYVNQVDAFARSESLNLVFGEAFKSIEEDSSGFIVKTDQNVYTGKNVIMAFGSNIPNDLGIYGEARTVARNLDNPEDYIDVTTLVIGGGNAAADIVAALSKVKRAFQGQEGGWRFKPGLLGAHKEKVQNQQGHGQGSRRGDFTGRPDQNPPGGHPQNRGGGLGGDRSALYPPEPGIQRQG